MRLEHLRLISLFMAIIASGGNLVFNRFGVVFILLTTTFLYFTKRPLVNLNFLRLMFLSIFVCIFYTVIEEVPSYIDTLTRLVSFCSALLVLSMYQYRDDFISDLYKILKLMPYQAILTVAIAAISQEVFTTFISNGIQYSTFLGVFYFHVMGPMGLVRADGLFFEPGVFQFYLNLLLYITLFYHKDMRLAILSVLGVLLTFSTTGYLIMCLIVLSYIFMQIYSKSVSFRKKVLVIASLVIIFPALFIIAYDNVDSKLNGVNKGSSMARQYDARTGISVAFQYPLTGIGFGYLNYYKKASLTESSYNEYAGERTVNRNNTNGVIQLFYSCGFIVGFLFLFSLYNQKLFKNKFVVFMLVMMTLTSEALIFTPIFMMLFFSFFYKNFTYITRGTNG